MKRKTKRAEKTSPKPEASGVVTLSHQKTKARLELFAKDLTRLLKQRNLRMQIRDGQLYVAVGAEAFGADTRQTERSSTALIWCRSNSNSGAYYITEWHYFELKEKNGSEK